MPAGDFSLGRIRNYFSSDLNDPLIRGALKWLYLGGILLAAAWVVYFACITISIPYPIEFREGAAPVMNHLLLNGKNPFSLENQPLGMNNYGMVYNLIALPFAMVFGNTLSTFRAVTFLFIILSSLLCLLTIYRLNKDFIFSLGCGIFIMIALSARGGLGAFPSALGSFLFLAGILIPFSYSFNYPALFASALFSLAAFYTKPYFVLSFAIVASYLFFFVSKKKGLQYGFFFALLFLVSFVLVRYFFKLYFIDVLVGNMSNAVRSPDHLEVQLRQLFREFYPSIILALMVFLFGGITFGLSPASRGSSSRNINVSNLDHPLIHKPFNYFAYFFMISTLVFLFVLGPHIGNYMNYSYQLVVPPFFLWLFQKARSKARLFPVYVLFILFNLIHLCQIVLNPVFLEQKSSKEWARLYEYVDASKHILSSPVVASEMIRLGVLPVDSGQAIYYYFIKPYSDNALLGPDYDVVKENGERYTRSINDAIRNKQYDRIILTRNKPGILPVNLIPRYYFKIDTLVVDMPQANQEWVIEIWELEASPVNR